MVFKTFLITGSKSLNQLMTLLIALTNPLTKLRIPLAILSKNCFQAETSLLVVSSASLIFFTKKVKAKTTAAIAAAIKT